MNAGEEGSKGLAQEHSRSQALRLPGARIVLPGQTVHEAKGQGRREGESTPPSGAGKSRGDGRDTQPPYVEGGSEQL